MKSTKWESAGCLQYRWLVVKGWREQGNCAGVTIRYRIADATIDVNFPASSLAQALVPVRTDPFAPAEIRPRSRPQNWHFILLSSAAGALSFYTLSISPSKVAAFIYKFNDIYEAKYLYMALYLEDYLPESSKVTDVWGIAWVFGTIFDPMAPMDRIRWCWQSTGSQIRKLYESRLNVWPIRALSEVHLPKLQLQVQQYVNWQ